MRSPPAHAGGLLSCRAASPGGPPNFWQSCLKRRTGRRPRRPTVIRNDFPKSFYSPPNTPIPRTGRTPGRPAKRISLPPPKKVAAPPHIKIFGPPREAAPTRYGTAFRSCCRGRLSWRPAEFPAIYLSTPYGPPPTAAHTIPPAFHIPPPINTPPYPPPR